MKTHVLHLEPHDDIHSARDKIGWTKAEQLLLVWPWPERVLSRRLDLVLLQRHARSLGTRLGIVCRELDVCGYARELGLPVFPTIESIRGEGWPGSARTASAPPRRAERPRAAPMRHEPKRPSSLHPELQRTLAIVKRFGRYLLFLVAILGWLGLAAILVPHARVRLALSPQTIEVTVPVTADVALDSVDPAGRIPARALSTNLEASARIPTTGTKDVPSTKASGHVVFTNLVGLSVTIPRDAGVRTTSGATVRFLTTQEVSLPSGRGQKVRVPILAVAPGPQGNVAAGQINAIDGPLGLQLAVVNDAPTTGGGVEGRAAVSEDDRSRLRESLLAQLHQDAIAMLNSQLGPHERMPADSVQITRVLVESYDRFPGEQADTLGLTLRVQATGTAVDTRLAEKLSLQALAAEVPSGYRLLAGSQSVQWQEEPRVDESGLVAFEMAATGEVTPEIDPNLIRQMIRGVPPDLGRQRLATALPLLTDPVVQIQPDWFPRVPWLPFRIGVEFQTTPREK